MRVGGAVGSPDDEPPARMDSRPGRADVGRQDGDGRGRERPRQRVRASRRQSYGGPRRSRAVCVRCETAAARASRRPFASRGHGENTCAQFEVASLVVFTRLDDRSTSIGSVVDIG